ncbi:SDR family NAD(P)-dependent oxidoreductase [Bacillus inaquosorum]|uniref:SDR family NAD(P)-dependent oxidoreductase n=1 Tax=Bacillus inaquosorum TaxID=483913 RepID=UPI00389AA1A1
MEHTVKSLYRKIKNKSISEEEAVKRMTKLFSSTPIAEPLKELQQILMDILNIETVDISEDTEWLEFGLDQVSLKQFADCLYHHYHLELTPAQIMAQGSLKGLASYVAQHIDSVQKGHAFYRKTDQLGIIAVDYLKKRLSAVLEIPLERLAADAPLENYGIDSVMIMKLTRQLEEHFGPLSKTLFFEYQTIQELADYLVKAHSHTLIKLFGIEETVAARSYELQPSLPLKEREESENHQAEKVLLAEEDGIAVIGLAGRYPGARNIKQFWENLQAGKDSITEISPDRWDHRLYFDEDKHKPGKINSKWGGFIEGVDQFDPLFFSISPREAEVLDPQERLFLECVYETLEDAGYSREALRSTDAVGVFVGAMYEEYPLYGAQEQAKGNALALGSNLSAIANRVSYFFNLTGPSMVVNTMCSSSLTSLHLACQSILRGECELAIAGGVNLSIHPNKYLLLGQGNFASSNGRCQSFGEGGDGYVPGEGVGAVFLKPLAQAIRDQDHIYGVIKGTAVNHGGKTNGYTVPNPNAQAKVIERALAQANVHPRTITYLEAHGTGTALGDPIEITGLKKAFDVYTVDRQFCSIGSVKSNIGHCEGAAGIAGLTKVLLQMKYKKWVPSLHTQVLNPHIDFDETPFKVQQILEGWERPVIDLEGEKKKYPRRAGISAFGAGGSNAHVVVEEYNQEKTMDHHGYPHPALIVLSAKDVTALQQQVERLLEAIESDNDRDLMDVAYTLQVGREAMEERLALTAVTMSKLKEKLKAFLDGKENNGVFHGTAQSGKAVLSTMSADDDMKTIIATWLQKGKYDQLLQLWVKGLHVDWNILYPNGTPYRISLPTYPFARQTCWFSDVEKVAEQPISTPSRKEASNQEVQPPSVEGCMYLPVWEEAQAVPNEQPHHQQVVIVYEKSAASLKEAIINYYHTCSSMPRIIQICLGTTTERRATDHWECDIHDDTAFDRSLADCGEIDGLYFLAEHALVYDSVHSQNIKQSQMRNEVPLLRLIKRLNDSQSTGKPIDCYILTLDNYSLSEQPVNPYGGGVTGLVYSAAQGEHRLRIRNLDLSFVDIQAPRAELIEKIVCEPPSHRGEVIKLKQGRRYHQVFYEMEDVTQQETGAIREKGVYVIVGGSGTIGQVITRYLMADFGAQVIWVGRTPEKDHAIQTKMAAFQGGSGSLSYIQADVTDEAQMKRAVQLIKEQYKVIHGAIFSGVVFSFENTIRQTTEAEFLDILNVKTVGGLSFYSALAGEDLDFMLYFSSGQAYAFSGASKFSAYAAGVTFADALVRSLKNRSSFPVGSINWGFWQSSVAGTFLEDRTSALEDKEGFDCFVHSVDLLTKGLLEQSLCLRPTPSLKEMMKVKSGRVTIYPPTTEPMLNVLSSQWTDRIYQGEPQEGNRLAAQMEARVANVLFVQLSRLGLPPKGTTINITDIINNSDITEKYQRWLAECLRILADHGYIHYEADQVTTVADAKPVETIWQDWQTTVTEYANNQDWKVQTMLLDSCLRKLPDILTGRILATEVLFPNTSIQSVEGIYKGNSIADYFNLTLADVLEAYIQRRIAKHPRERIRIIEAGAGTGGTSAIVLKRIEAYSTHVDYVYTDISKSFLLFAEEQYGTTYPNLTFQTWNVEQSASAQGVAAGSYDILIASNVLHATQAIRHTLQQVKAVLKPNGLILLNEMTQKNLFATVTFGLLDGWWLFQDDQLRIEGSPLIAAPTWQRVMEEEGFRQVAFLGEQGPNNGQRIIVAESDGWVRLPVTQEEKYKEEPMVPMDHRVIPQAITKVNLSDKQIADYVKATMIEQLAIALKVSKDRISPDVAFSEYGVDSILGVAFVKQLNEVFKIDLNSAILFDYTSVHRLAEYIADVYQEHIVTQLQVGSSRQAQEKPTVPIQISSEKPKPEKDNTQAIAVVGMAGQFPDAPDLHSFWEHLKKGHDGVHELPANYLDQGKYYDKVKQPGKTYSKWGGILAEKNAFDPLFFNISPREAASMSPHQRLILQESWKALEDAGYNPKSLAEVPVGVFIGAEPANYYHESFTGSSDAIVASRLSYYLNLMGPAMVVNTGCSSSAAAIHLACESLRRGETTLAIAGGVYAKLDTTSLVALSGIDMISPTGKCFTFDEKADGTVLSEGVGIVVLKPLHQAEADGDAIYGVIAGSGMNQDGASNGITAPNGLAQERLLMDVYKKYDIQPSDISYVEAHGTGTKLGDPIEVNALIRTFKRFTSKEHYCAIGSTKSSIGHTGAAAGVIGLMRVLLSMAHRQIPRLINFNTLNPLIALQQSPFYINTETVDWVPPRDKPLLAAVNSFGHSGTNVHLVVQEYKPSEVKEYKDGGSMLIPLSARKKDRLQAYAEKLLAYLNKKEQEGQLQHLRLSSLAYTLQTGREAMAERVVFLVNDMSDLIRALSDFCAGKAHASTWQGQQQKGASTAGLLERDDEDLNVAMMQLAAKGKLTKIAQVWAEGMDIDWDVLYGYEKPLRIHLPVYPFAKKYYERWEDTEKTVEATQRTVLHPLLQENTSNLQGIQFRSTFAGSESFLKDHLVQKKRMMPGTAYLEMARAAVEKVAQPGEMTICLHKMVWLKPFIVEDEPQKMRVTLSVSQDGEIVYDMRHDTSDDVIYHRGRAVFHKAEKTPTLDIPALIKACNRKILSRNEAYKAYQEAGLMYGPSHQGIEAMYIGDDQVLAKLELPQEAQAALNDFVWHPGMMDSALQAALGMMDSTEGYPSPRIPFALEEAVIYGPCAPRMWSVIQYSEGNKAEDEVLKLDIDLCDDAGRLCAKLKGFSLRAFDRGQGTQKADTLLLAPIWHKQPVDPDKEKEKAPYEQRIVLFCGFEQAPGTSMVKHTDYRWLQSEKVGAAERYIDFANQVLNEWQSMIHVGRKQRQCMQLVIPAVNDQRSLKGLAAMLKTGQLEHPHVFGQLIEVDELSDIEDILEENIKCQDQHIRYTQGQRWVMKWDDITSQTNMDTVPFKNGCTYLITGGTGGLGLLFAKEIANQVDQATVILVGRSPLDHRQKAALMTIPSNIHAVYECADVSDGNAVKALISDIQQKHGAIHGIIHSAGVVQDSLIRHKTKAELQEVMTAKVEGLILLDQATQNVPLDFFLCFSSGSAVWGSVGQADYAAANAFMDHYMHWRSRLVAVKQRNGRTLSINWPYWKNGGMTIDESTEQMMRGQLGLVPLLNETGIQAFYRAFALDIAQVLVMSGNAERMRQRMIPPKKEPKTVQVQKETSVSQAQASVNLRECMEAALFDVVSQLIHVQMDELDAQTGLDEYGFDSITFSELANELNQRYQLELMPTIFFEHNTLRDLADYLSQTHHAVLKAHFDRVKATMPQTLPAVTEQVADHHQPRSSEKKADERVATKPPARQQQENNDIAIVGMSGLFPGGKDLDDFWENLVAGKDCITEIPNDRWDWREYDGDPLKETNKTNVKWGAFIDGVNQFDPLFFGISPRQAELMDPQQRLLMMYVWKAIEDAGYAPQRLSGSKIGIFAGMGYSGYGSVIKKAESALEGYSATGMAAAMGPNRMSYFLNVHGPSEPIDTACSSSLVAIDRAVNAIQNGYCDSAIAGGVNLILTPELHISFSKANMLSEDGRCKTFSEKANGYVRGEGIGMIFLKKLEDAERAGDHIYGVIKGTSVNHGGRANSLTAPNPKAQSDLLIDAYQKAGIDPRTVTYIEAHGTGTELGDPIEINGLKTAFAHLYAATGEPTVKDAHCGLGSIKSNIGHLELAAGIAGVFKLLLQLKHKKLVKSLHADVINPYIQLEDSPFYIVQSNREWTALKDQEGNDLPRRAGVSSFGFGGVNAHVVIEEYIPSKTASTEGSALSHAPAIILLSAKDDSRLKEQAQNLWLAIHKGDYDDGVLADLAYTLQVGRDAMEERLGLLVTSIQELSEKLKEYLNGKQGIAGLYRGQATKQKGPMAALQADDDFHETLSHWLHKGKYHKLISMWVNGMPIDWDELYASKRPKRISLPTYPFARERYWVKETGNVQAVTQPSAIEKKIFRKTWRKDPAQGERMPLIGTLIVLTTSPTIQMIKPMLADQDVNIIPVVHGEVANQGVATDYYSQEAGETLYQQLKQIIEGPAFQGMIDLTAYDGEYEQDTRIEWGKITFLQHLITHQGQAGWKVMQVTYSLQSLQIEQPTLQGARLAGLYRMLGAEYKQTPFITMDSDCTAEDSHRLWVQVKETFCQQTGITEYCYRQGQRFLPEMMEVSKPEEPAMTAYNEEDVILITGGSRGIGAQIAERVISQGAKHLVIMGREALPDQSMWSEVLAKEENSPLAHKVRHLKSLKDQGIQVLYDHTALTDSEGLKLMVNKIHQQMGPITGVFHCAGIKGENPSFIKKTIQEMQAVCEPKIIGLTHLHKALADEPLAFFLLFSSVASVIPFLAAGQSDYAMANAYMDFYAAYQAGQGKACFQSIQWPAWKETGMAAGGMETPAYVMSGLQSHNTEDGLHLMEVVRQLHEPVCMPAVIDPVRFASDELLYLKGPVSGHPTAIRKEVAGQRMEKTVMGERAGVMKWLKQLFQKELKLAKTPDEQTSFAEYGVDSIIIAQIVQIIQGEIGQTLPPSLLLERDTIAALADYLTEHHGAAFQTQSTTKADKEVKVSSEPAVSDKLVPQHQEDMAIIGIASRFPDAPNKEEYWELLKQEKRAIRPVPKTRWTAKDGRRADGGWITGIDQFDPDFFNINPADAAIMDPQARLLLEESLKTIYDAGYDHRDLRGKAVGVYIGGRSQPVAPVDQVLQSANPILGMGQNYLAANISKFFDFRGPSMVVDTACSSGMTGLLMAADALRAGRIDMALVGAVSLLLSPMAHDVFAARNILSRNGRFEIFDKQSMGEVLGEGIGLVMVKRLSDAIRDGNHIYGVVKGIAVNNDGRTLGPGSPSLQAQKQVMKEALALSGKKQQDIGYIELNGGGTPIMDTIEIKALSEAYDLTNQELDQVYLGATKPNIGHLLLASGMASFIRCLLSVYHGEIPPFLSAKVPFDHYDFAKSRIQFNRESVAWSTSDNRPRTAALSSFPDGGTNYHVIIESFTPNKVSQLSPKTPPVLQNRQITGIASVEEEVKQEEVQLAGNVWGEIR